MEVVPKEPNKIKVDYMKWNRWGWRNTGSSWKLIVWTSQELSGQFNIHSRGFSWLESTRLVYYLGIEVREKWQEVKDIS